MANPTCSKSFVLAESACYSGDIFNLHKQLALEVYLRMQTVRAIGGTNYTNAGTATVANPNPPTAA